MSYNSNNDDDYDERASLLSSPGRATINSTQSDDFDNNSYLQGRDKVNSDFRGTLHDEADMPVGISNVAGMRRPDAMLYPKEKKTQYSNPLRDPTADRERTPLLADTPGAESEEDKKYRWWSIRIMYLAMFLSSVAFSILIASIQPFLQILEGEDDNTFFGIVVASYSVGQCIASPVFGYLANKRPYKEGLIISICINMAGNLLYCFSDYSDGPETGERYFMLVARFIVGISAGNVAITRAYVAGATHLTERTQSMSFLSACQTGGFVVGPLLGSAFSSIDPGIYSTPIRLNYCTIPALFSVFLGACQLVIVILFFREYRLDGGAVAKTNGPAKKDVETAVKAPTLFPVDKLAVGICIFMFFMILFVFSLYETIGTPLAQDEYGWSKTEAARYVGILLGVSGGIGVIVFMLVKPISAKYGDRKTMIGGMILVVCGFILYLPWGPPSNTDCTTHDWCPDTPTLPLVQYIFACFFISLGYPVVTVLLFIIYSKVLGPGPQGTFMGLLTAAGSLARVLGPLFITNAWDYGGPYAAFGAVLGLLIIMTAFALIFYKRLIPRRAITQI